MNYLKENPVGIDKAIKRQQIAFYDALSLVGVLDGYGRVYKNKKDKTNSLEVYKGNAQYENVSHSDVSKFFFEVENDIDVSDAPEVNVNVHFILDLDNFYPNEKDKRNDEEIRELVLKNVLRQTFNPSKIHIGAYKLSGIVNDNKLFSDDMHPKHIFTLSGKLSFNYKRCK